MTPQMYHCRKRRGEEFWLGDVLKILIVEISAHEVKLTLCVPEDPQSPMHPLSEEHGCRAIPRIEGPGYFVSPSDGCYRYVANANSTTRLRINELAEVIVDSVEGLFVELTSNLAFEPCS